MQKKTELLVSMVGGQFHLVVLLRSEVAKGRCHSVSSYLAWAFVASTLRIHLETVVSSSKISKASLQPGSLHSSLILHLSVLKDVSF
jgi:hypothetical protein